MTVDSRPRGGTPGLCETITVTRNCNFTRSNSLWASVPEFLRHYIICNAILRIEAEAGCASSFLFGSSNSFCRSSNLLISAVLVNCLSPQRSANFFDVCNLCVKICSIYEQMHKNDGIAVFDLNVDSRFQHFNSSVACYLLSTSS